MDKYSKQMENKLYTEVSVTDRLPPTSGYFLTDKGKRAFNKYVEVWQNNANEEGVKYWLEEIDLEISDNPELNQPRPQLKLGL